MKILKKILVLVITLTLICTNGYCEEERAAHTEQIFISYTNEKYDEFGDTAQGEWDRITSMDGYEKEEKTVKELDEEMLAEIETRLIEQYGEGNYNIDYDEVAEEAVCKNGATDWLITVTVYDEPAPPAAPTYEDSERVEYSEDKGDWECITHRASDHRTDLETHLKVSLNPNRENLEGKESLYSLGDEIVLTGNACNHVMENYLNCKQEKREVTVSRTKYTFDEDGNVIDEDYDENYDSYTETREGHGKVEGSSTFNTQAFPVSVVFKGFKVTDKDNVTLVGGKFSGGLSDSYAETDLVKLNTGKLKITEVENIYYDETKGAFYGIIEVSCNCCKGGCYKEFRLYFGDRGDNIVTTDLTVKVTPNTSGTAKVTGIIDQNSDGKISDTEKAPITVTITDEKTLKVVAGNVYEIKGIDGNGYTYSRIVTVDGNEITNLNPYDYTMPYVPVKLIVHFTKDSGNDPDNNGDGYTLYVSSNEGGKAFTDTRPTGTTYKKYTTTLGDKKVTVEKISKVKAGTEFELKYEADPGYEFDRWEYRPFIKDEVIENGNKIKMPNSDLTATAIFKKKAVLPEDNKGPILKVTSNNEKWGVAYAVVNGKEISISEVKAGDEYEIVFYPEDGYYFTNWDYDSIESPFIDAKNRIIVMPRYDLEITAFFAPIPTLDAPSRSGDVKFVAETLTPEDNIIPGTVPEDLENIAAGAEVTFGVTANEGYEFVRWYFTDTFGKIIAPDNEYTEFGSGKFIMPDYDIIAHAVFKKIILSNLEVRIIGNGSVTSDGEDIPNGTIITVSNGKYIELTATPADKNKFLYWTDENGNILSYDKVINCKVDEDRIIIAWFTEKKAHTLYITSMEGGNAWTIGNENHPESSIIKKTDALGKTVYKIENVYEDEKFTINYKTNTGFTFDKWEYKPYITAEKDIRNKTNGSIEILMPNSDLTVTAVFKNDKSVLEPELRVTSNNKDWGVAYAIVNGKNTQMDKTYKAIPYEEYTLYYEAKEGYYFVNWSYSTTKSPFVGENIINMPNKNLEVMALFSPIPEPVYPTPVIPDGPEKPDPVKHSIDFIASPPEGGSVPEDLNDEVLPGSKVTIGVTPNVGWEFDYWYFEDENGNIIEVEVQFEPDGSGYFIMPDEDVRAIAVFKKAGRYTLYVTYTEGGSAWVIDKDLTKTVRIDEAIAEEIYDLEYIVKDGYKFVGWEFRWDKYPIGDIQADIYKKDNKALMPYSDLTVTAKFEKDDNNGPYKLRVTSNNYLWGNAWVEVDGKTYCWKEVNNGVVNQNSSSTPGIALEANKDYTIYYKVEDGYIYTNSLPADYFTRWPNSDFEDYLIMNIKEEFLTSDIEITVYFKPSPGEDELYDLTVSTNPDGAATVTGAEEGLKEDEEFTVNVKNIKSGYKFEYWYYETDGIKVIVSHDKKYTGKMPGNNLELIAYFEYTTTPPGGGSTDDRIYDLVVKIEGDGDVTDDKGNVVTHKEMKDGESITLVATPEDGYIFYGWMIDGEIVSTNPKQKFTIDGKSITVTACFVKATSSMADSFKIISVRDLRWKDYFVEGSALKGNVFTIPSTNTTMLQTVNNYPDVLKMGYAVEFELTTSQIERNKAVLVIEPTIINNKTGQEVPWDRVIDKLTNKRIDSKFEKIVIYGKEGASNSDTKTYQTSVKYDGTYKNNGVSVNKMIWNWVYYLPGEISFTDNSGNVLSKNMMPEDVTIRFNIELHEVENGIDYKPYVDTSNKGTLKQKLVLFEQKYSGTYWKGDVYKYSMKESLLDDIYDNAQN